MLDQNKINNLLQNIKDGTYGYEQALADVAAAQLGEDVRAAMYAAIYIIFRYGSASAAHDLLGGRDKADQHPISAITGLPAALKNIENKSAPIIRKKNGSAIALHDSSNAPIEGLVLYGKTTQDGTPTPENPIPLVSAGDNGKKIDVQVYGKAVWGVESITGVKRITVKLATPLPPGVYTVSGMVTTTDTDANYTLFGFKGENDDKDVIYASFARDQHQAHKVTINKTIYQLYLNASSNLGNGEGDTCTWSDVQIEVGETYTGYELPKAVQIMSVPTTNGLPGIPDPEGNYVDASGQRWTCDEKDFERGVYIQRIKRFGTADAVRIRRGTSKAGVPYIDLYRSYELPADTPMLCNGYVQISTKSTGKHGTVKNYASVITIYDDRLTSDLSDEECVALLNSDMAFEAIFKLSSPGELLLTEEEISAYKELHTNKPNTAILNNSSAGMSVSYAADAQAYVSNTADFLGDNILRTDTYSAPVKTAWEQRMLDRIDLTMLPVTAQRRMAKAPSGYIQAGEIITGIVYSSVWETVGNVGVHVPLSTYYSALENPASVMYTQDIYQGDTSKSTYYGITCSSFVTYALGRTGEAKNCETLARMYIDNVLDIKTEDDLFQICRGYLLLNTIKKNDDGKYVVESGAGDHVKMVRDVLYDRETGRLVGFNIVEGTKPYVAVTFMYLAEFLQQLNGERPYYVVRVPGEDYGLNVPKIKYSHSIYPDRGDGGKYTLGETVELYIPDMTAESIYYSMDGGAEVNIMLSSMTLDIVNGVPVHRFTPSAAGTYSISVNTRRDDPCIVAIEPEAAIL